MSPAAGRAGRRRRTHPARRTRPGPARGVPHPGRTKKKETSTRDRSQQSHRSPPPPLPTPRPQMSHRKFEHPVSAPWLLPKKRSQRARGKCTVSAATRIQRSHHRAHGLQSRYDARRPRRMLAQAPQEGDARGGDHRRDPRDGRRRRVATSRPPGRRALNTCGRSTSTT